MGENYKTLSFHIAIFRLSFWYDPTDEDAWVKATVKVTVLVILTFSSWLGPLWKTMIYIYIYNPCRATTEVDWTHAVTDFMIQCELTLAGKPLLKRACSQFRVTEDSVYGEEKYHVSVE